MTKLAAALVACAALGCGRLKSDAPDGAPAQSDAGAAAEHTSPEPVGDANATDATTEVAVVATGRPLPDGVPGPTRFFDSRAILVGNDQSACTHQTPPSGNGHRWCGVIVGAGTSGVAELWVVDVTRAAMGDPAPCDGTNDGCLRLTDKVDTRSAAFFDGDTLLYGTDNTAPVGQDFLGPLFAWRPGWSAGRQISSNAGIGCVGNTQSAAVACLDDPDGAPAKRDSADVRAGYLLAQTGDALPSFGRWPLRNDNESAWQAGFSPDGAVFILADADTIGAPRTLRLSRTADVGQGPPAVTLEDVSYWQVSNDGQKLYVLRGLPQPATLLVADFPSGANAQTLETGVLSFNLLGAQLTDRAIAIQKSTGPNSGLVELLVDRTVTTPKVIFSYTDVLNGAVVSPDLRYTTWLDYSFNGTVFRNADLTPCLLNEGAEAPVYNPSYLASAGLMFWQTTTPGDKSALLDAYYATPDRCRAKALFATHVDLLRPVGDRGVVFDDGVDQASRTTLKYIAAGTDGATLDPLGPIRIQGGVTEPVVFVGEGSPLLVYSAAGATADDGGLFVFGPVPF